MKIGRKHTRVSLVLFPSESDGKVERRERSHLSREAKRDARASLPLCSLPSPPFRPPLAGSLALAGRRRSSSPSPSPVAVALFLLLLHLLLFFFFFFFFFQTSPARLCSASSPAARRALPLACSSASSSARLQLGELFRSPQLGELASGRSLAGELSCGRSLASQHTSFLVISFSFPSYFPFPFKETHSKENYFSFLYFSFHPYFPFPHTFYPSKETGSKLFAMLSSFSPYKLSSSSSNPLQASCAREVGIIGGEKELARRRGRRMQGIGQT